MTPYTDILRWSQDLPQWQRDALGRLATDAAAPSTADIDELAALCHQEANNLPFTIRPQPLAAAHVPVTTTGGASVSLTAISDTQAINAILDGQTLSFGSTGITAIYGDNGAGKSGFSRLLRHACHARGQSTATPQPLPTLPMETAAGRFLKALGPTTAIADLDALQLNAQETAELQQLGTVLSAPDPGALAAQYGQRAQRLRGLATRIETLEASLSSDGMRQLQRTIANFTLEQSTWARLEPLPPGWSAWLAQVAQAQDDAAQAAAQSAQAATRAVQTARQQELSARQTLIAARDPMQAEIKRLADRAARTRSIQTCTTTGISRKAAELTKTYVTDRLLQRFDAEAKALRLPERVRYRSSRTEKGAAYQRVVLETADWTGQSLGPLQVLSEGERRAVALATFLAELDTRDDRSAIVLDDPVSSLDHDRRRVVAKRLAECARDRQVIVFTHDLVFLHMLRANAQTCAVNLTNREIRCRGPITGHVRDRAPAMAMSTAKLISELNTYHQRVAAHYRRGDLDAYERELTYAYGILREAWERAIEDILLNQAVQRFDHQIQTQRLKPIHDITLADLQIINTAMSVCSRWLPGHAQAATINEPLPHPDDLRSEIQRLDAFAKDLTKRRKG